MKIIYAASNLDRTTYGNFLLYLAVVVCTVHTTTVLWCAMPSMSRWSQSCCRNGGAKHHSYEFQGRSATSGAISGRRASGTPRCGVKECRPFIASVHDAKPLFAFKISIGSLPIALQQNSVLTRSRGASSPIPWRALSLFQYLDYQELHRTNNIDCEADASNSDVRFTCTRIFENVITSRGIFWYPNKNAVTVSNRAKLQIRIRDRASIANKLLLYSPVF